MQGPGDEIVAAAEEATRWCTQLRDSASLRDTYGSMFFLSLLSSIDHIVKNRAGSDGEALRQNFRMALQLISMGKYRRIRVVLQHKIRPHKAHGTLPERTKEDCKQARAAIWRFYELAGAEVGYGIGAYKPRKEA